MSSETGSSLNTALRPSDVKASLKPSATTSLKDEREEAKEESDEAKHHIDGVRKFYNMRTKWSWFLLGCIAALLLFHIGLTIGIGVGVLDFSKYQWFLPLVIVENFAQIITLAVVVVKFLFSEPKRQG